jgi:predicted nucleotidyltransferase
MTSLEDVISTLRAEEPNLRAMGVARAAVFGSIARGEATERSDIDVLIDLDPARKLSLFDFIGIKHYLDDTFGYPVDLVSRRGINPLVLPAIERDLVRVF